MDDIGHIGPGQLAGMGNFAFAVGAVGGDLLG
jgi:hypothetical protein